MTDLTLEGYALITTLIMSPVYSVLGYSLYKIAGLCSFKDKYDQREKDKKEFNNQSNNDTRAKFT